MVWNSALFIDSSSFTSPGKWNHRVSFASNDLGIVIWLDFIETLKIRLKASQTWLFDSASTLSPHFNNSPNSWIDLTAFPAILPCFTCGRVSRRKFVRFEKSAKVFKTEKGACNSRYFFSRLANCACLSLAQNQRWRQQKKSWFGPQNLKSVYFIPWRGTSLLVRYSTKSLVFVLISIFSEFFRFCFSGINRHFHMACIHDKFATSTGKRNISSKQIWEHLQELYNLQALVSGWVWKLLRGLLCFGGSRKNFGKLTRHSILFI